MTGPLPASLDLLVRQGRGFLKKGLIACLAGTRQGGQGACVDRLVNVELFGQSYEFKASEQVVFPEEVAGYVARQVKRVTESAEAPSRLDTLIVAALNIASDYLEMKRNHNELLQYIDRRSKSLIENIDQHLK